MTVVIGTAGHIDHGKTTLLRALTGIDADRLPEEKRRGLTIDVGYAHGSPDGGPEIDYVDVPGHDRLVGNMLVGVGEIDAALLVVAADDGPRAQTFEHLGLLHAMGIGRGLVALTKVDLVTDTRSAEVASAVAALLSVTSLAGAPIVPVSATSGAGLEALRSALAALRDDVEHERSGRPRPERAWLAIDRVFSVRGRGVVVTGSARGTPFVASQSVRIEPGGLGGRVRGIEVHDVEVPMGPAGGRVALNLAGMAQRSLRRGLVVTTADGARDPFTVIGSDRLLVVLDAPAALPGRRPGDAWPPPDGSTTRIHIGTDQTGAILGRSGRDAVTLPDGRALALLRLDRPVATAVGERFVLRRPRPAALLAGGIVLDPDPARGRSRRRQTALRLTGLVAAVGEGDRAAILAALIELHGHLISPAGAQLAADVQRDAADAILAAVEAGDRERPGTAGLPLSAARGTGSTLIRRSVSIDRPAADEAATTLLAGMLADGRLERSGETVHLPGRGVPLPDPVREEAMRRLLQALDDPAPPALRSAASAASCPPDAVRELERNALIVVVGDDLAWSAAAFERLSDQALGLATAAPLTPAALRDATGTSRKYVMALLEELDRRGLLRRTPEGHVPGPRA